MSDNYLFHCMILNHQDNYYMHTESISVIAYAITESKEQYQFLDRQYLSLPMQYLSLPMH